MKTNKAKVLSLLLVTAFAAAGLLAAVAMAWPQPQARSLPQRQPPPTQPMQPAEPLPGGGPTQSDLNFAE
jgi:hypothetical protein